MYHPLCVVQTRWMSTSYEQSDTGVSWRYRVKCRGREGIELFHHKVPHLKGGGNVRIKYSAFDAAVNGKGRCMHTLCLFTC